MPEPDWSPALTLLIAILATWRISHLLAREEGPFDLVLKLRLRLGDGGWGRAMDCPYCLSLWLAAPLALLLSRQPLAWGLAWLAISGGACVLERLCAALEQSRGEPR